MSDAPKHPIFKDSAGPNGERIRARDARVQYIAKLIASGEYQPGPTLIELAEQWRVNWNTITDYAAEAKRIVSRDVSSSEEIRAEAMTRLRVVTDKAFEAHDAKPDPGHLRNAIEAIKSIAGFGGAPPTTRTEQTGANGAPVGVVVQVPVEEDDDE